MKRLRWTLPLALVAVLLLLPWVIHAFSPTHRIDIVVVDKTVPFADRVEHRSLFWLLDHEKIRKRDGTAYDVARDYVGAFPGKIPGDPPVRTTELTPARAGGSDLLYLADSYGVYEGDLDSRSEMRPSLERTPRIYGGLETEEAQAVAAALSRGTTVIAEFNTLASPTGSAARETMETLLGVRWTRWIGRYFPALDDEGEVPGWVRRNYELEWGEPWEFTGAGWVLLRGDTDTEVLREGIETAATGLTLQRARPVDPLLIDARDGVRYAYWFDVVEVDPAAAVLASYRWELTDAGRERLHERGLPLLFPAVVRRTHARAESFYFAGDFIDNRLPERPVPAAGYPTLMRWLEGARLRPTDPAFYWRFYVPMMQRMLADHRS